MDEKDHDPQVKKYLKHIERSTTKWRPALKDIQVSRNYALGVKKGKNPKSEYNKSNTVQSNQIFATLQAMLPLTYAKNPEIAVKPEAYINVDDPMLPQTRQFCRTLEVVINKVLTDAGLKRAMLGLIRSIQTSRIGWLKISYQRDFANDPIIANRLEDAQDQLARLNSNMGSMQDEEGYSSEDIEIRRLEFEQMIASLEKQVQVIRAEGLVIDNVPVEDMRMDPDIQRIEDYHRATWIAQRTWMTKDAILDQFDVSKKDVDGLTTYQRSDNGIPVSDGYHPNRHNGEQVNEHLVAVWEYWCRDTGSVYWLAEGSKQFLREPWQPEKNGQRFFPFFSIGFNYVDGREWPISDVELLMRLQDEYDLSRTQEAKHRELTKPMFVADRARVNRQDVSSFAIADVGEILLIDAGGQPVNQVFQPAQHPPMIPNVYDITRIRGDMEWVSGLGDAQRGAVGRAKTATEASIQQEGLSSRVDARKDQLEDFITEMSKYATEIVMQEMPSELVQRYAGVTAFWPEGMSKDQLFTMSEIKIRGGSTGKPNRQLELEKWGAFMPEIKEALERAIVMQEEVMIPINMNPWIKLMQEMMRKADEAFDVMELFPPELVQMLGQIGQQKLQLKNQEMQMQQMQMQLEQMQMGLSAEQQMQQMQMGDQQMAMQDQQMGGQPPMPPQGMPPEGMPPEGMPPQGMPEEELIPPEETMPPEGMPPQPM